MTAFASLILLIFIAVLSMSVVAYSNFQVEKAKHARYTLNKKRTRAEELEEVVLCLDQICDNRMIPKLVNDEVVTLYDIMIGLNPKANYLEAGLSNAKMRSNDFNEPATHQTNRVCQSDAQIARAQAYLIETLTILKKQYNENKLSTTDLQHLSAEVEWLHLQVSVISTIAQGHKAYNRHDILTANAFYKKAQSELMRSGHPDKRRHKMIKQLADILFGRRKSLDKELMPEDDYNPDNTPIETSSIIDMIDEDQDNNNKTQAQTSNEV